MGWSWVWFGDKIHLSCFYMSQVELLGRQLGVRVWSREEMFGLETERDISMLVLVEVGQGWDHLETENSDRI